MEGRTEVFFSFGLHPEYVQFRSGVKGRAGKSNRKWDAIEELTKEFGKGKHEFGWATSKLHIGCVPIHIHHTSTNGYCYLRFLEGTKQHSHSPKPPWRPVSHSTAHPERSSSRALQAPAWSPLTKNKSWFVWHIFGELGTSTDQTIIHYNMQHINTHI